MPRKLKSLQVNRVALVDRGANQHADVVLWKRAEPNPDLPDVHKPGEEPYWKRQFTSDQRQAAASAGAALPDGSFPINNRADLANAIRAFGRASDKAAAKRHIISRARALGATDMLPDDWNVGKGVRLEGNTFANTNTTGGTADYTVTITNGEVEKAGRKISARRLKELEASRDTLNAVIEEAQVEPATKREEDRMPENEQDALTDEARQALPEEAQKYLAKVESERDEALKAAEAKKAEDKPQDEITKGMSEEVRKAFAEQEERIEKAEKAAADEREKRENAEVAKRLETAKAAGIDPEAWAPKLRKTAAEDPEWAAEIEAKMNAAAERVRTGALFSEIGKSGEFGTSEPYAKLEKMAEEKAAADSIPKDQAFADVMATPEGQRLYAEYANDSEKGA